ncbi:unnamed protein product [Heterobilharzia americana]|nr:unnamed protein product [Heterobilharzia americana]
MDNTRLFACSVFFTVFGFCSNFISFVSPYWIQSLPEAKSQFQRIGLWTVCFDGYMRPGLYDKAYFGCYYIYYVIYDRVRDWLNPGLTLTAALVAFAVARCDSRWMPYPDLNVLSWAYAVGVFSFISTFIAFIISFIIYLNLDEIINRQKENEDLLENEEKMGMNSPLPTQNDPRYTEPHYFTDPQPSSYMGSSKMPTKSWKDSEVTYNVDEEISDSENPSNSRFNTSRYMYDPRS